MLLVLLSGGCGGDRERPMPVEVVEPARLSVLVTSPRQGLTVRTGEELAITVVARDLNARALTGAGVLVKRFGAGSHTLDSMVVHFSARADTTHEFMFRVPDLPTNTQVDFYGLAYAPGDQVRRTSPPTSVVVVRCADGVCR